MCAWEEAALNIVLTPIMLMPKGYPRTLGDEHYNPSHPPSLHLQTSPPLWQSILLPACDSSLIKALEANEKEANHWVIGYFTQPSK